MSPARRRAIIDNVQERFRVSERFACNVLGQHRSTLRKVLCGRPSRSRPLLRYYEGVTGPVYEKLLQRTTALVKPHRSIRSQ